MVIVYKAMGPSLDNSKLLHQASDWNVQSGNSHVGIEIVVLGIMIDIIASLTAIWFVVQHVPRTLKMYTHYFRTYDTYNMTCERQKEEEPQNRQRS